MLSRRVPLLLAGLLLTRCAAPEPAPVVAAPANHPAPAAFAAAPAPSDATGKIPFNDPPASPDSPLCGRQAREENAMAASLQGPRLAGGSICASFTCYDALTATYLGADNERHVCR